MPSIEDDTVRSLLEAAVETHPDAPAMRVRGAVVTYGALHDSVRRVASGLIANGVAPGDRVAIMADNSAECVMAWMGASAASAIDVPFNTGAQGEFLSAQLATCTPKAVIGEGQYLDRVAGLMRQAPDLVVCIHGDYDRERFARPTRHLSFAELVAAGESGSPLVRRPSAGDIGTVMFTSGSTGVSKAAMLPQRYWPVWGRRGAAILELQSGEVVYSVQPLFHLDGRAYLLMALASGGTMAIGSRFSASGFWDEVRLHDARVFSYIGTMLWLLWKQPPSDRDRDHNVRLCPGSSTPVEIHRAFEERFGVSLREGYGMTEAAFLIHADASTPPGRLGRIVPEIDLQVVDDVDVPVAPGQVGEAVWRPLEPFVTSQGYWGMPEATLSGLRNQWFHTGDLIRAETDGEFTYIGRKKDSIRRRGENISAWEVEQAASQHPEVLEAAAIGVPSPVGEEDVALLVVLRTGASVTPAELREFVGPNLPTFALPRYVEFVDSFPKTASERVDKQKVRAAGISPDAWDAEATKVRSS